MTELLVSPGTVYLLHFETRYKHAGHYTGWTPDLDARLDDHAAGRGARLTAVVREAGIGWVLSRTWEADRNFERQLKRRGSATRHCPVCRGRQPVLDVVLRR